MERPGLQTVSEETVTPFIFISFIIQKFASLTAQDLLTLMLSIYQFSSMWLCVCTCRVHALLIAMSFTKGVLLKNLLCAPIMSIHAPLLHFSVSSINCYPPLPLLMRNCRSVCLPVQRVVHCCVFVYDHRRILPMLLLLLLSIACTIHFTTTICCSSYCMVCSISYFPIPGSSDCHSWHSYFLVSVTALFVINY
jgi:hypothetical protein